MRLPVAGAVAMGVHLWHKEAWAIVTFVIDVTDDQIPVEGLADDDGMVFELILDEEVQDDGPFVELWAGHYEAVTNVPVSTWDHWTVEIMDPLIVPIDPNTNPVDPPLDHDTYEFDWDVEDNR